MTALELIVAWAASELPAWQSDAVRRLLVQDALTDDDRQDFLAMLRAIHNLSPDGATPPKPQPLLKGMISGAPKSKATVVLKALVDLRSINKIPDGSSLPFGHQGLTAIYGENGSGKSGYARVLKRACRARDTQERILPNVYQSLAAMPARAKFKLSINGGPDQEIEWEAGKASDEALTNITVFDSKCARVIVDEKNEASYLPYGAHVFEALVTLLDWIRKQIEALKPTPESLLWPDITPTTKPGIFLACLTYKTQEKEVDDAVSWSSSDAEKLENVTKQLADLEANDPIKQAAAIRSFKQRVASLVAFVEQRATGLSDERLATLQALVTSSIEAEKALELASQETFQNEPLPGVGESAWQILYNAARSYSTEVAYPNEEFPVTANDSRCVFCMQSLSDEARDRLLRFAIFVEQKAKKNLEIARESLGAAATSIQGLRLKAAEQHANTIDEVKQRDEVVAASAETFLASSSSRLEYFELVASRSEHGNVPPLPSSPADALKAIIEGLEKGATALEQAANPAVRDGLRKEKSDLAARKCFAENKSKILGYLADLKTLHKCDMAVESASTAAITRKGKSVVSDALTPQLKKAIQSELAQLGAGHLPLNLKPSGSKGETLHQLELSGAKPGPKVNLTDVLSEGEQRVVALAGFLAEVNLGAHCCPVVFDDPVSSLDHRYRATIAARLMLESKKRQVLVFTHDVAFLLELQEKASGPGGSPFTPQTVLQQHQAAGIRSDGLPWHTMPVAKRLDYLRNRLSGIKNLHGTDTTKYDQEAAFVYGLLRETWEAAIEEVVLHKTIVRHSSEVQTLRLKEVGVTTDQYSAIDMNMSKCSEWMIGHDKAKALDAHRPPPNDLLGDIDALQSFVKECKKAGEALRKERDAVLGLKTSDVG